MIDPVQSSTTNKKNDLKTSFDKKISDMNSADETFQITDDQQKKGNFFNFHLYVNYKSNTLLCMALHVIFILY